MPSLSRSLEQALHRAIKLASERHHEYATLEHLLLALIDDTDASQVMKACNVDMDALRKTVQKYVDEDLATLVIEDGDEAKPTTGFQRVVQRAVLHVQNSGRDEVTGANVLVALFTERESHAVYFLQEQNMNRLDAVSYISHGIAKRPGMSQPKPARGTDEDDESGDRVRTGAAPRRHVQADEVGDTHRQKDDPRADHESSRFRSANPATSAADPAEASACETAGWVTPSASASSRWVRPRQRP